MCFKYKIFIDISTYFFFFINPMMIKTISLIRKQFENEQHGIIIILYLHRHVQCVFRCDVESICFQIYCTYIMVITKHQMLIMYLILIIVCMIWCTKEKPLDQLQAFTNTPQLIIITQYNVDHLTPPSIYRDGLLKGCVLSP